jgi:hypothetical protein
MLAGLLKTFVLISFVKRNVFKPQGDKIWCNFKYTGVINIRDVGGRKRKYEETFFILTQ